MLLDAMFVHRVDLVPQIDTPFGIESGPEETGVACAIVDEVQLVRDQRGEEVVSNALLVFPIERGFIAPGTAVRMPANHGGDVTEVISCVVADAPGLPLPSGVLVRVK